ncbi:MAG TPA: PEP-CTERM sorting domain-containing protein [Candidatus Brocadiia bacterium]|nr:PEP-CTERM sorting domain-containing protein [Candidatus Brocadiia bacterium]
MLVKKVLTCFFALAMMCATVSRAGVLTDPSGDAAPGIYFSYDLLGLSALPVGSDLVVTVPFVTGPLFPAAIPGPSSLLNEALYGYVEFDTDQNPGTGSPSYITSLLAVPTGLGVDYFLDFWMEGSNPGMVGVFNTTSGFVGLAPIVYGPTDVTITTPLAMLGGDDGIVSAGSIIGDYNGPTDYVVPEPASVLLLGLGGVAVALRARKSRKS